MESKEHKVITLKSDKTLSRTLLTETAAAIAHGRLVVIPLYGSYVIAFDPDNSAPFREVALIRKQQNSFLPALIFGDFSQLEKWCQTDSVSSSAKKLLLSGKLSLVLQLHNEERLDEDSDGRVLVNIPNDLNIHNLLMKSGPCRIAPAAIEGSGKNSKIKACLTTFQNQIDIYWNAGTIAGKQSSVVDLTSKSKVLLREGALSNKILEKTFPDLKTSD